MPLTGKQRRHLRSLGHHLDPVVQLGKLGLTSGVIAATTDALESHELIKVRINGDREQRVSTLAAIIESAAAIKVQATGGTALIYKKALELKAHLSNLSRHS